MLFSKAGSSPHKKLQLRCWRRPLMVRQPYSAAVKSDRRSGFLFSPEVSVPYKGNRRGRKDYWRRPRWEVDPPLRVREDWWVFESPFFNGKKLCKWAQWKLAFKLPSAASFIKGRTGRFSKKLIHTKYSLKSEQPIYKNIIFALHNKELQLCHK